MSFSKTLNRLIEPGDLVECVNPQSRFYGMKGTCEELDADRYDWPFIMYVPEVAERVDPANWMIVTHVKVESPSRMTFV